MDRKKLLIQFTVLIFLIFVFNFTAMKLYWYSSIWYYDILMHFFGGVFLGLLGFYIFSVRELSFISIFKIFAFVLLIGLGWEVFEIIVDDNLSQAPFNALDTISDMFFDVAGGLSAILFLLNKKIVS